MIDVFEMAKKLDGEYKEVFEKAQVYGSMYPVDEDIYEDKMLNLYDVLTEAQSNEKTIVKIIGKDIESFCENYFKPNSASEIVSLAAKRLDVLMRNILIVSVFFTILAGDNKVGFFERRIDVFPFIAGFVMGIGFIVVGMFMAKKMLFKFARIKPGVYDTVIIILYFAVIICAVAFGGETTMMVPAVVVFAITGGYMIVYRGIKYIRTGTIANTDKLDKETKRELEEELSKDSTLLSSADGMAKRFKRINKKREKSRKNEMTFREFVEKIRKEEGMQIYIDVIMGIFFLVMLFISVVDYLSSGDLVVGIVFSIILIVVEYKIFMFFHRINDRLSKERLMILQQCEEQGIDIVEYAENIKKRNIN